MATYSTNEVTSPNTIKVSTYNVLSSHLSEADYFTHCDPMHLDPKRRLIELKKKLDVEVAQGAIICLQEVSTLWSGALTTYFAGKGYTFCTGLYGNKFNGYMGVGMAVPLTKYDILDVDITCIADTKRIVRNNRTPQNFIEEWLQYFRRQYWEPLSNLLIRWNLLSKPPEDPWQLACSRFNQMVSMRLAPKNVGGGGAFVVGTYHMPCMFRTPAVMMIHCALSAQHIARYSRGLPYVFCGDFNVKPSSPMYSMMTHGRVLDDSCEESPLRFTPASDPWRAVLSQPLVSAYAIANKAQGGVSDEFTDYRGEPDFTNHARIKDEEPFIDTLDYIWLGNSMAVDPADRAFNNQGRGRSGSNPQEPSLVPSGVERVWKLQSVLPLKHRKDVKGPLPTQEEPSDHVLLSANLLLVTTGTMGDKI